MSGRQLSQACFAPILKDFSAERPATLFGPADEVASKTG
jgi:hypothetical protein